MTEAIYWVRLSTRWLLHRSQSFPLLAVVTDRADRWRVFARKPVGSSVRVVVFLIGPGRRQNWPFHAADVVRVLASVLLSLLYGIVVVRRLLAMAAMVSEALLRSAVSPASQAAAMHRILPQRRIC